MRQFLSPLKYTLLYENYITWSLQVEGSMGLVTLGSITHFMFGHNAAHLLVVWTAKVFSKSFGAFYIWLGDLLDLLEKFTTIFLSVFFSKARAGAATSKVVYV